MQRLWIISFILLTSTSLLIEGQLYGVSTNSSLVLVNDKTGAIKEIGPEDESDQPAQGLAVLDTASSTYYFLASNLTTNMTELVGLTLSTGEEKLRLVLPFQSRGFFVGDAQYMNINTNTGELLVAGYVNGTSTSQILSINPQTGAITEVVKQLQLNPESSNGWSAYDPKRNIHWLQQVLKRTVTVIGVSLDTGKIVYRFNDTANSESVYYDPVTTFLWGFYINTTARQNWNEGVVYLNPTSTTPTWTYTSFTVPLHGGSWTNVGGFDPVGRVIYALLAPTVKSFSFNLVGVNITSGVVVSNVGCCSLLTGGCPLSLAFYNTPSTIAHK